MIDLHDTIFI